MFQEGDAIEQPFPGGKSVATVERNPSYDAPGCMRFEIYLDAIKKSGDAKKDEQETLDVIRRAVTSAETSTPLCLETRNDIKVTLKFPGGEAVTESVVRRLRNECKGNDWWVGSREMYRLFVFNK